MISKQHVLRSGARLFGVVVAVVASVTLSVRPAHAQTRGDSGGVLAGDSRRPSPERPGTMDFREALRNLDYSDAVMAPQAATPAPHTSPEPRQRSTGRKVLGGVIGAVGGFFAGAYIGHAIDRLRDCRCDDPGLVGVLLGAPIGAATFGILGVKYF